MDRLILSGMRFFGRHGVLLVERTEGQEFFVDLEVEADLAPSGRTDALERTIDYRTAYEIVRQVMEGEPRHLLEALAEEIAQRLLTLDAVAAVIIRVRKPRVQLPGPVDYSAVEIRRTRA